jgi:hypothetical protein
MKPNFVDDLEPVLNWHEGDDVTLERRNAMASWIARSFNLSPEKEAELREEYERIPEAAMADGMAAMIAAMTMREIPEKTEPDEIGVIG